MTVRNVITCNVIKQFGDLTLIKTDDGMLGLLDNNGDFVIHLGVYSFYMTDKILCFKDGVNKIFVYSLLEKKILVNGDFCFSSSTMGSNDFENLDSVLKKVPFVAIIKSFTSGRICILDESKYDGTNSLTSSVFSQYAFFADDYNMRNNFFVFLLSGDKVKVAKIIEGELSFSDLGEASKIYLLTSESFPILGKINQRRCFVKKDGGFNFVFDANRDFFSEKNSPLFKINCDEIFAIYEENNNFYDMYIEKKMQLIIKRGERIEVVSLRLWNGDVIEEKVIASFNAEGVKRIANGEYSIIGHDDKIGYCSFVTRCFVGPKYKDVKPWKFEDKTLLFLYRDDEYFDVVDSNAPDEILISDCQNIENKVVNHNSPKIFKTKDGLFVMLICGSNNKLYVSCEKFNSLVRTHFGWGDVPNRWVVKKDEKVGDEVICNVGIYNDKTNSLPIEVKYKNVAVLMIDKDVLYVCLDRFDKKSLKVDPGLDLEKTFGLDFDDVVDVIVDSKCLFVKKKDNAYLWDWSTKKLIATFPACVEVVIDESFPLTPKFKYFDYNNERFVLKNENGCWSMEKMSQISGIVSFEIKTCVGTIQSYASSVLKARAMIRQERSRTLKLLKCCPYLARGNSSIHLKLVKGEITIKGFRRTKLKGNQNSWKH